MKQKGWVIFTMFILIIILLFVYLNIPVLEKFENNGTELYLYVITLKHEDRLQNIKTQQSIIDKPIQLFDAVKGDFLNMDEILGQYHFNPDFFNASHVDDKKKKREVGCYLSHLQLYKQIKNAHHNTGYSIVFEDDFKLEDNFIDQTNKIINSMLDKKMDFDIIFLGQNQTQNKGDFIMDNIYHFNNNLKLWGTHGLLIHNKNIDKIIEKVEYIDCDIDIKIANLAKSGELKVFILYPFIVNIIDSKSTINDFSIETFDSIYTSKYSVL